MQCARLALEYLKVLLSAPVIFGLISLVVLYLFKGDIREYVRWLQIRLPGRTVLSRSQSERREENKPVPQAEISSSVLPNDLTSDLTPQQREAVEGIIKTERAISYLWEYRYLNCFLVYSTQKVLDWLVSLPEGRTNIRHYDAIWFPLIRSAKERGAIIGVLDAHHLIEINDGVIKVTDKGREYHDWRGPLPDLPLTTGSSGTA